MSDTPEFLSQRLRSEGDKITAFFARLTPPDWEKTVYEEGCSWTVRQIFAHFVSTEANLFLLVKDIAAGGKGAPEDFNIDLFNQQEVEKLESTGLPELLERFRDLRHQTADLIGCLSPADLEKKGRHPFLGLAPVSEIVKLIYLHIQIHLRDIRKVLA